MPFPFLFYKYGAQIRAKCKFAAMSEAFMRKMQSEAEGDDTDDDEDEKKSPADDDNEADATKSHSDDTAAASPGATTTSPAKEEVEQPAQEAVEERRLSLADTEDGEDDAAGPRFVPIRTVSTRRTIRSEAREGYNLSPFDLDRVNTRDSFKSSGRRSSTASSGGLSRTWSRK